MEADKEKNIPKKENTKPSTKDVEQANKPIATIMPTMLDESEDRVEKKHDLSGIIPNQIVVEEQKEKLDYETIRLISRDNNLKSDGTVSLATIDQDGNAILKANFQYPEQIDIASRKEQKKQEVKKNKREKKKLSKDGQKIQSLTAIMALIAIAIIVGAGLYYYYGPNEEKFKPLTITIELGDKLPLKTSSYVKPGIGKELNDILYVIDTKNVDIDDVGEYKYSVTYKGITKEGRIIIEDTTPPELEIRNVTITEGTKYDAESFVESCKDLTHCNFAFQDSDTQIKYTSPGFYTIFIVATDAYKNPTIKKANLVIESKGNVKYYHKETPFDFNTGYSVTEKYELHFINGSDDLVIQTGKYIKTLKYQDELKYSQASKDYIGIVNYECNDSEMTITETKEVNIIGSNYSYYNDINTYLTYQGFKEGQ